eukprot:scaffold6852_cov215-Ochromonas_danica.AAC.18
MGLLLSGKTGESSLHQFHTINSMELKWNKGNWGIRIPELLHQQEHVSTRRSINEATSSALDKNLYTRNVTQSKDFCLSDHTNLTFIKDQSRNGSRSHEVFSTTKAISVRQLFKAPNDANSKRTSPWGNTY